MVERVSMQFAILNESLSVEANGNNPMTRELRLQMMKKDRDDYHGVQGPCEQVKGAFPNRDGTFEKRDFEP